MNAEYPENCTKVLNHGFVRLVASMGDDAAIVQAARVSYGAGTKTRNDDNGLIRYLMRHRHTTPFEMVEFKFHMRMPIFVARQWIRHRTASVNEYSGRYSEMPELFYVPEAGRVTKQSTANKQGSEDEELIEGAQEIVNHMEIEQASDYVNYQSNLSAGMSRELARINLPLSTYTEWYWKIDLHNLLHFLKLRLDSHAQYEIRAFAEAMAALIKPIVPMAWDAFEDYHLLSLTLSAKEIKILSMIVKGGRVGDDLEMMMGNKRETEEFKTKLDLIWNSTSILPPSEEARSV